MSLKPVIAMTAGDPWSITTEAWARLVFDRSGSFNWLCDSERVDLVFCGSGTLIERQLVVLGSALPASVRLIDDGLAVEAGLYPEAPADRGRHAVASLNLALRCCPPGWKRGSFAVVTGPIDKKACSLAGFEFPGQTEFFEDAWSAIPVSGGPPKSALMLLAGPRLRVGLSTRHVPLRDVSSRIAVQDIAWQISVFITTLRETFGITSPRVAVCGLNPHAGDRGLFGDEEARIILPAIELARGEKSAAGASISGPHPADTVFYEAWTGNYDGVLAMYHDQGLGPLKALHFHEAVNISAGLGHLRVSPDHGPASGLFMTNKANLGSFAAAIELAVRHTGVYP
jgi:4-hydroxythreonine-4-phosphate dehydrogenase